jgi:hypothetical protein
VKTVACVVLALAMVSAAFFVLSFSLQPATAPVSSVSQMFDVDLVYAYVGKTDVTNHSHFGMEMHPVNLYPAFIYLNYTYLGNTNNEPYDAKFEIYLVQLISDTECRRITRLIRARTLTSLIPTCPQFLRRLRVPAETQLASAST